ncbi:MAG: transposase [Solirubrobacterales bacterium]
MPYLFSQDRREPGGYHVWSHSRDGIWLFRDDEDRKTFEQLMNRHLSAVPHFDRRGRPYRCLRDEVRMCARAVLSNHFHLVLWQKVPGGIDRLMRRVLGAYTLYYHRKYGTSGPLFEGRYRARLIQGRKSFMWRVAYVHDNHKRAGLDWRFSTHRLFVDEQEPPSWLEVTKTLEVFGGLDRYKNYMSDFRHRRALDAALRVDNPMNWS